MIERRPSWYRATPWWRQPVTMQRWRLIALVSAVILDTIIVVGWAR